MPGGLSPTPDAVVSIRKLTVDGMQPVYKVVDKPKLTSGKLPLNALYVFEEVQPFPPTTTNRKVKFPLVVYVYVKSKKLLPRIVLSPFPQNTLYC